MHCRYFPLVFALPLLLLDNFCIADAASCSMSAALLHACCMLLPSDYSACCHRWTALLHALFLFVIVACTFVVKVMRCLLPLIIAKVLCCLLQGLFAFSNGCEEFVNESFHCILHLLNSMVEIVLLPFIATFLVVKLTLIGRNLLAIKYQLEKNLIFVLM